MKARCAGQSGGPGARGFTLVEAICALVIVAALGSVSSGLIYSGVRSYRDASARAVLHSEASTAMERAFRLLSSIERNTAASVVAPRITSVTAGSITWNNGDSLTLSGTQLMASEGGGTARPILNSVVAFTVTAYDQENAALGATLSGSATQAIRRLQLQVTVTRDGISETVRMRIFIRCTMSGAAIG